ncbi:MAG: hypothetical protein KatS3mg121_0663 [Gammaproteobacteria bacterium]|nr:MAG: hypothetical protein KatS3mg121_0663 [Gammaproteobacteria bacterium]
MFDSHDRRRLRVFLFALFLAVAITPAGASDHADPMWLRDMNSDLTGLFVFARENRLVAVIGLHRALRSGPPYDLVGRRYRLFFDLHSPVRFDEPQDVLRYGGTVVDPAGIAPDVSLSFTLDDDARLAGHEVEGLSDTRGLRLWAGLRDDPFILPRFFGTNVIAIVAEIPFDAFPGAPRTFLAWATAERDGRQVDHVGRANRTMLPRFELLNTLPPSEHVAALRARHEHPGLIEDLERVFVSPLFAMRRYDLAPDVLIFDRDRPPGYPNGRRLEDDVADLSCRLGDCLLWELSFVDSAAWPRPRRNDKPFLNDFPYLAEPWPPSAAPPQPALTLRSRLLLGALALGLLFFYALPWWLYLRARRAAAGARG